MVVQSPKTTAYLHFIPVGGTEEVELTAETSAFDRLRLKQSDDSLTSCQVTGREADGQCPSSTTRHFCSLWSSDLRHLNAGSSGCHRLCSQPPDAASNVPDADLSVQASEMQFWILSIHSWALGASEAQKL